MYNKNEVTDRLENRHTRRKSLPATSTSSHSFPFDLCGHFDVLIPVNVKRAYPHSAIGKLCFVLLNRLGDVSTNRKDFVELV